MFSTYRAVRTVSQPTSSEHLAAAHQITPWAAMADFDVHAQKPGQYERHLFARWAERYRRVGAYQPADAQAIVNRDLT
jgi:hypothetical protein